MDDKHWELIGEDICKQCFIRIAKPSKKDIKHIELTDYKTTCSKCGRVTQVVSSLED